VAVILAATLLAMELVYRVDTSWAPIERFLLPPLGVLAALVLGGWSAIAAANSGLSGRAWVGIGIVSALAIVVDGLAYSTIPDLRWARPFQGLSALVLIAALAIAARQSARFAARLPLAATYRRSYFVFLFATAAVASLELRLWLLVTNG